MLSESQCHGSCLLVGCQQRYVMCGVTVLLPAAGPAWSLGIRPRGALEGGSNLQATVPGPGAYHPDNCTYRADGPAFSFPAKSPADM